MLIFFSLSFAEHANLRSPFIVTAVPLSERKLSLVKLQRVGIVSSDILSFQESSKCARFCLSAMRCITLEKYHYRSNHGRRLNSLRDITNLRVIKKKRLQTLKFGQVHQVIVK